MQTIPAVYERGVFRPTAPVQLPEGTLVHVSPTEPAEQGQEAHHDDGMDAIYEVLSRRYRSGCRDTAARHDEHQP